MEKLLWKLPMRLTALYTIGQPSQLAHVTVALSKLRVNPRLHRTVVPSVARTRPSKMLPCPVVSQDVV